MNAADLIIVAVLAVVLALAVRKVLRNRRNQSCGCGCCSGSCEACSRNHGGKNA